MKARVCRKDAMLASVIVALTAVAMALIAVPAVAMSPQSEAKYAMSTGDYWEDIEEFSDVEIGTESAVRYVSVFARGWAFERVDNETVKQYAVEMNLTLTLGRRKYQLISIAGVNGSVLVNGAVYAIQSGQGLISTKRHAALIRCDGVDAEGNSVTLKAGAVYFWWGGKLFAFRSKAVLRTAEKPMLLLQRGVAKTQ